MFQALMCKFNLRHEWHVEHAEDGSMYRRCRVCSKDDDERGRGRKGDFSGWVGPSGA